MKLDVFLLNVLNQLDSVLSINPMEPGKRIKLRNNRQPTGARYRPAQAGGGGVLSKRHLA